MTNSLPLNRLFSDLEIFSSPELAVMDLLKRRSGISNDIVLTAAGLSVWAHRNGHPCVHLGEICGLIASESSAEALKIVRDSLPPATQFGSCAVYR